MILGVTPKAEQKVSAKLLEMARKLRMNTEARKNLFCALMSADDYLDALDAEVDRHGINAPLVEILRSPAPAGFVELFDARDAARSANR